jgi:hypothetical protein
MWLRTPLLLLVATLLSGCVASLPPIRHVSELKPDEVLLVGKIELVPALAADEQQLRGIGSGRMKNKISIVFSENKPVYKDKHQGTDYKQMDNYAGITPGQTFFLRHPRKKALHYLGGIIYLSIGNQGAETMSLPGGLKYRIQPGSKYIYLGTIRYHRDVYNAITDVQLVDESKSANNDFRTKLGGKGRLEKVRAEPFKMRPITMY